MGYILGVLDYIAYIAADVDFYNIEGNSGDSYLPFVDLVNILQQRRILIFFMTRETALI